MIASGFSLARTSTAAASFRWIAKQIWGEVYRSLHHSPKFKTCRLHVWGSSQKAVPHPTADNNLKFHYKMAFFSGKMSGCPICSQHLKLTIAGWGR